jgi:hypothetical protein
MKLFVFKHKDTLLLLALYILFAAFIMGGAYFGGTHISPDSTNYLRAAQSILNGYGLHVNAEAGDSVPYFSHWPIGYPFLIAAVSFLTGGTEVYLASKILSLLLLAGIFALLYYQFKRRAWLYALLCIANPNFLTIFFFTWSEQPFIFGTLWLCITITAILKSDSIKLLHYVSLGASAIFLFLSRYIGVFSIAVTGITFLWFLILYIKKHDTVALKKCILLAVAGLLSLAAIILYLYSNYKNTGHYGGDYRLYLMSDLHRSLAGVTLDIIKGQMQDISYLISTIHLFDVNIKNVWLMLLIIWAVIFAIKLFKANKLNIQKCWTFITPFVIAISYLLSYIVLAVKSESTTEDPRFFIPSTILMIITFVAFLFEFTPIKIKAFIQKYKIQFIITILILFLVSPLKQTIAAVKTTTSYPKVRAKIINDLANVHSRSLVLTYWYTGQNESFVNFIRPDLLMMDLTWSYPFKKINDTINTNENVYLYVKDKTILRNIEHLSDYFIDYIDNDGFLIKIK